MEKYNESFIRWQGRSIQQLGFVNNLLIGLSTAIFIFQIKIAFDSSISFGVLLFWSFLISMLFIVLSIFIGCFLAWVRLKDFHITAKIARKRETGKRDSIEYFREKVDNFGQASWSLLLAQAILFMLGLITLLVAGIISLKV